jgi:hypothetical protein
VKRLTVIALAGIGLTGVLLAGSPAQASPGNSRTTEVIGAPAEDPLDSTYDTLGECLSAKQNLVDNGDIAGGKCQKISGFDSGGNPAKVYTIRPSSGPSDSGQPSSSGSTTPKPGSNSKDPFGLCQWTGSYLPLNC